MNKLLYVVFLVFFYQVLFAQVSRNDSIIESIKFSSELEKAIFSDFLLKDSLDYFSIFSAIGFEGSRGDINSRSLKILNFARNYTTPKFKGCKNTKKAKILFNDVHDEYFEKYELAPMFGDIFSKGNYNCVTASALYGVIFENLGLDYTIKLLPQHVFLILYPDEEAIVIETTNPMKGYVPHDDKSKREFVKYLKETKAISEKEYNSMSTDELFDKHYYSDKDITLRELIGVQYYNLGLVKFSEKKWAEAFDEFEKANVFFKDDRVRFMLNASLGNYFIFNEKVDIEDLKYLVKIPAYSNLESYKNNVVSYFNSLLQSYLIDEGDTASTNKAYRYVSDQISDSTIMKEVSYYYYFELGRYSQIKGSHADANEYFRQSMESKPKNIDVQNAFIQSLAQRLQDKSMNEVIDFLEESWTAYPDIRTNNIFATLLGNAYLFAATELFKDRKINAGHKKLQAFESYLFDNKDVSISDEIIGEAYTAGAVYYFGAGNYKKAKELIYQGLKYAPNNYQLRRALNSF